jgi:ring-1,2-phenylacetyl-CoA epoxidase subunit PaaD
VVIDAAPVTEARVRRALADVHDPEIPAISIVDLGIVRTVTVDADAIRVELLPTFVGCPALDAIHDAVTDRLAGFARDIEVRFTFAEPWTSDRISPAGREALRRSGFAPPVPGQDGHALISLDAPVACPYCGSSKTRLENAFGPARCRSIRYCTACRQPFEQFKAV